MEGRLIGVKSWFSHNIMLMYERCFKVVMIDQSHDRMESHDLHEETGLAHNNKDSPPFYGW